MLNFRFRQEIKLTRTLCLGEKFQQSVMQDSASIASFQYDRSRHN